MIKKYSLFLLSCLLAGAALSAQNTDPVLFSIQGQSVRVSEFKSMYAKTAKEKADFSRASLEDNVERYIRIKLKVQKARDMRLDTLPTLKEEIEANRRQLAASYLVDLEVTDRLAQEAYDRMQQDAKISHIFFACKAESAPADTLIAYQRAMLVLQKIRAGASFEQMAVDNSDDKNAKETKGSLGYVTAMLPNGFYAMENAIYGAKTGTIVGPVRTRMGYNILRVEGFRPARGQMDIAHIFVTTKGVAEGDPRAQVRIDSIWQALQSGAKWDELCAKTSNDQTTAAKGGFIGPIAINRFHPSFEEAAFALRKDGDYSRPVQTNLGWHIIRRVTVRPPGTFDEQKAALIDRIKRDERSEVAKQTMLRRIQRENNFTEYPEVFDIWCATQTDDRFYSFGWHADPANGTPVLFRIGSDQVGTVADFERYVERSVRERIQGKGTPARQTATLLYNRWKEDRTFQYEESVLNQKNPEFKALTREFEDIALLYEASKIEVWDKANADTIGLLRFFEDSLRSQSVWQERAEISLFTIRSEDMSLILNVRSAAAKKSVSEVLAMFNKPNQEVVFHEIRRYEKGQNPDVDALWKAGSLTTVRTESKKAATFMKIEAMLPPSPKSLADSRGTAISAYQAYLEQAWVERLRKEYKVVVNQAALDALVKK